MLIEEARDISGLSYEKLNERLPLESGDAQRYAIGMRGKKARAPSLDRIQELENKVARLLKRPAHTVVIEDNSQLTPTSLFIDLAVDVPKAGVSWSRYQAHTLQFGYQDDWPTYRRLKYMPPIAGIRLLDLYAWQYGSLWEKGFFKREDFDLPNDKPLETALQKKVDDLCYARRLSYQLGVFDDIFEMEQTLGMDHREIRQVFDKFVEEVLQAAGILPEHWGKVA
ncbi:hypothetical protein CY652_22395 [Burkholderia sp. WAC0059]|nr:hypothetical protein CY652_22395 [Burkholderia sp. WAC0059]